MCIKKDFNSCMIGVAIFYNFLCMDSTVDSHRDIQKIPEMHCWACPTGYILRASLVKAHLLLLSLPVCESRHLPTLDKDFRKQPMLSSI